MYFFEKYNNSKNGDEFYTRLKDIEKELSKFDFRNKTVYCNCDNPEFSKFYKYFHDNFNELKLKLLIATYYDENPMRYEYDGAHETTVEIESGDFRQNEETLKRCDIVVTNPPFSAGLPISLVEMCKRNKKDVLFLCKNDWYTRSGAFEYYKSGFIDVDSTEVGTFDGPNSSVHVTCYWYTSLPIKKPCVETLQEYDIDEYPKYVNYDAIEVKKNTEIPAGYDGVMGVPISFAKYLNRSQFDIVGVLNTPKGANGKVYFKRLLIRHKK